MEQLEEVKDKVIEAVQKLMEANEAYDRGDISWEELALYTQAYPDEILNLKGDGWKVAIVSTKGNWSTLSIPDLSDIVAEYHFKQVIWEADND